MSRASAMVRTMDEAVAQLGPGPLTEESVQRQLRLCFPACWPAIASISPTTP